ncbi:MAG: S41 family peptidase [Verrucomicrobia bacterium]|nr:S41 family peptidase [Verrucomicrobiota bacterium]
MNKAPRSTAEPACFGGTDGNNRWGPRMKTRAAIVLFVTALAVVACAADGTNTAVTLPEANIFLTGNEQAIINRFLKQPAAPDPKRFSNSLDHAIAVLVVRAEPKPEVMRLARAAVIALCAEFERQTGGKISAAQQDTWVSDFSRTKSFDTVVKRLTELDPKPADRPRLINAGLDGMLRASGWDAACVLPQPVADELKRTLRVRETPAEERGVVGLKLDRWPMVEVVPASPAAEAGLKTGDAIVAVNGKDVSDVKTMADGFKILRGLPGEVVKLAVQREDRRLAFEVTRISVAAATVHAREAAPGVLLITIPTFEGSGIATKVKNVVHTRAANRTSVVILDLRDNGGGRPEEANGVADVFLDGNLLQVLEFRDGVRVGFKSHSGVRVMPRLILLMNRNTASGAEMLAMSLRNNSAATIVGENTAGMLFGKDGVELTGGQTIVFRSQPTVLSITGRDYSMTGIPPDTRIRDDRSGGKDDILLRALALAKQPPITVPNEADRLPAKQGAAATTDATLAPVTAKTVGEEAEAMKKSYWPRYIPPPLAPL